MNDLLQLHQVHKWVGEGTARIDILKGVSMTLREGEFVAIMGASGFGKTTLLNLMGLLDNPSEGSVVIRGKDASHLSDDETAGLRAHLVGFVFQSFHLLSYLNAQENIELPMTYTRVADPATRAEKLLAMMKLEHRATAYPATLSGGERQRVAMARALANGPSLLLADEPTGALDSRTGAQILDLIGQLNRQGAAVVLVTHDGSIARRAQRILYIKDGRFE